MLFSLFHPCNDFCVTFDLWIITCVITYQLLCSLATNHFLLFTSLVPHSFGAAAAVVLPRFTVTFLFQVSVPWHRVAHHIRLCFIVRALVNYLRGILQLQHVDVKVTPTCGHPTAFVQELSISSTVSPACLLCSSSRFRESC